LKNWIIKEHSEFKRTIKLCPTRIQRVVNNSLRPQMEIYPLDGAIPLKNKLKGHYEQKINNYRLIFRINSKSHVIYFLWIRPKPHATTKKWV